MNGQKLPQKPGVALRQPVPAGAGAEFPERRPAPLPATVAALAGLTVVAIVRRGAFHRVDALVVAAGAAVLLAMGVSRSGRPSRLAAGAAVAFAGWWLIAAGNHGEWGAFLPLGASAVAFAAGVTVTSRLSCTARAVAAQILVGLIGLTSLSGLTAVAFRLFPFAARAQNLWRVTTPLTYANAAGLLLAMGLLLAVGLDQGSTLARVSVCLCAAGLAGTQSRGAAVALLVGAVFVPLHAWRQALLPLAAGIAAGGAVVATSPAMIQPSESGPVVAVATVAAVAVALSSPRLRRAWRPWMRYPAGLAMAGGIAIGADAMHHTIAARLTLADRSPEWSAALRQWVSSPLFGKGPDRPLLLDSHTLTFASFAHNEYLQVLAGGGLLGGILLLAAIGAVIAAAHRYDTLSSCCCGALVALAVAGFFDFDWHLAALGLIGGWIAGLAIPPEADRGHP